MDMSALEGCNTSSSAERTKEPVLHVAETEKPTAAIDKEKGPALGIEHLRALALSAVASSALLMSAPAHAEKYEHSPALSTETLDVLKRIGLERVVDDKNMDVRIPRASASGHYIVHIDVAHVADDLKPEKQQNVIETQKQSYAAIRAIIADQTFATFYPEGMTKEKGPSVWEADKKTLNTFKARLQALKSGRLLDKETLKQAVKTASLSSLNLTGVSSGEMTHTLAATGLSLLKDEKDPEVIQYLRDRAPLGEDTLYYYGALKYAYEQGYVQNIKGCESQEELEHIRKLKEQGEKNIDHTNREKKAIDCIAGDLQASGENFAVTTFGAAHDFSNEIDDGNKANKQDLGYIVLTPRALSWYVDTKKPR